MTEVQQQNPDLEKAYSLSDELAEMGKGDYPYEFLTDLQKSDPYLFQEFLTLDQSQDEDSEVGVLAELDSALAAFEQKVEEAKPSEAKDWMRTCEANGYNDVFIRKLLSYVVSTSKPLGEVYSNKELIPGGYVPSLGTDQAIARMIQKYYSEGGQFSQAKLFEAYQKSLSNPRSNEHRVAKEAADFILQKGPAFKEVRAKAAEQKAAAETARREAAEKAEYLSANADLSMPQVLTDLEDMIKDMVDMGDTAKGFGYSQELKELRDLYENPIDDAQQEESAQKLRELHARVSIDADKEQAERAAAERAREQAPTDAPVVAEGAAEAAGAERVAAAAPEARVDYREDARKNPRKYVTEGPDNTIIFDTKGNRAAEKAIRIEDLYASHPDLTNRVLTSSRYGDMQFVYKEDGAQGPSFYDKDGSGKRLAILNGDRLKEVTPEPVAAAAAPEPAPEPVPELSDADVEKAWQKLYDLTARDQDLSRRMLEATAAAEKAKREGRTAFVDNAAFAKEQAALAAAYQELQPTLAMINPEAYSNKPEVIKKKADQLARYYEETVPVRIASLTGQAVDDGTRVAAAPAPEAGEGADMDGSADGDEREPEGQTAEPEAPSDGSANG